MSDARAAGDPRAQLEPAAPGGEGPAPGAEAPAPERPRRRAAGLGRTLERGILPVAWLLLVGGFGFAEPSRFLTVSNFSNIFGSNAVLFVLALALLVPLTNGDIDLSVGAMSGLVSMVVAVLNVNHNMPILWACLIGLAVGLGCGLVNGLVVILVNADPFIVTLGSGTVFTGLVYWLSGQSTITGVSASLSNWTYINQFLGIPIEFYYGLAIMLVIWYVLTFTPLGQRALFVGRNREVARLSGFEVSRTRLVGFVSAGLITAVSGILYAGTTGSASPSTGDTLLLPAYAAAFLSLTTIQPGRFNAWGTGIAIYFLATGIAGLELYGAQSFVQELFYGGILVIAIVISRLISRHRYGKGV